MNIDPERIPCLLKGLMAGNWFDLQSCWAAASGVARCPLAVGLLVLVGVQEGFNTFLWVAGRLRFVCPRGSLFSGLLLGLLALIDLGAKSVEVRRIWEVYDESLSLVHPAFWEGIRSSFLAGDFFCLECLVVFG